MAALPPMSAGLREQVRERLLALASAHRHELVDFSFGDSEIFWAADHPRSQTELALGYRGQEVSVTLLDQLGQPLVEWEGAVARPLLELGRLAGRERNDETAELTPAAEQYLNAREV
jgi:hypothetical protein